MDAQLPTSNKNMIKRDRERGREDEGAELTIKGCERGFCLGQGEEQEIRLETDYKYQRSDRIIYLKRDAIISNDHDRIGSLESANDLEGRDWSGGKRKKKMEIDVLRVRGDQWCESKRRSMA